MHTAMNVKISSNFKFTVSSIQYMPNGELHISLSSGEPNDTNYEYTANLGDGGAMEKPSISLAQYTSDFTESHTVKEKTKISYRLMLKHLRDYGDIDLEHITTAS